MKYRKPIYTFMLTALLGSGFCSCSDWLDITPEGTVEADRMFQDKIGYEEAIAGMYQSMGNANIYGQKMITLPDALAQYWYLPAGTEPLTPIKEFDFTHADATDMMDAVWKYMYTSIAQTNLILQYMDEPGVLDSKTYNILKGEALGTRAYLHLDVLRLFGPQPANLEAKAVPYRTKFDNQSVRNMTINEVLAAAEKDLLEAYKLLADDPIKEYGRKNADLGNYDSGLAENFRGCRMNYYAVCGTLARLYVWKGDLQTAAKYAQEVIDANATFWLIDSKEVGGKNMLFQSEVVFGLYLGVNNIASLTAVFGGGTYGSSDVLTLSAGMQGFVFGSTGEGASSDYRNDATMWTMINGVEGKASRKYQWVESSLPASADIQPIVPMIRLTEMYYIVAEANAATPDNGISRSLLDEVRVSRNIPKLYRESYSEKELKEIILAEARRDYVAEGQLFYLYKRWNKEIETNGGNLSLDEIIWQLPLPKIEEEYN